MLVTIWALILETFGDFMVDFTQARQNMVDCQLRTNKIVDDNIINAFSSVPRELFVEYKFQAIAYTDKDISVGFGRYLIAPMIFGKLLQSLNLHPNEVALDVGCATGYSSAVLAHLVMTVVALESKKELAVKANNNFRSLAVDNAVVVEGEIDAGYSTQGPYDIITIAAGLPFVPKSLKEQLADGGRLCTVIISEEGLGKAVLLTKSNGIISERILFDANISSMPGFGIEQGFVF